MEIYLAPMEGITTYLYRSALHKYYGGVDKYFTPFLCSKNLNYKDINDVMPEHNKGMKVIPQILANQPDVFLSITEHLEDYGYEEVNLNLGCPSGTVVSKKRGAGLLSVPEQLDAFLEEIFSGSRLKISIKTRIGIENMEEWDKILSIYEKYPMTELIIHPRFQKEFYKGTPHPEAVVQASKKIKVPICYNGDIKSEETMDAVMQKLSGTEQPINSIMLGRGAIANPALPRMLGQNKDASDRETFKAFHNELMQGYMEIMSGEKPVLFHMKELWCYMGPERGLSDKELKSIKKASRLSDYRAVMNTIL